ncbi:MAG: EF-P lysine aminoacylase EpmA [Desulforhopalus sp.]
MLDVEGLHIRAAFLRLIRTFFYSRGFLEVDTPLRQPVYIPESNITPVQAEGQFLQTSPELCMKRLLAAGCKKIFQICPSFRKEERGRLHLEEFQMLEWYRVDADYNTLMADCQALLQYLAERMADPEGCGFRSERQFFQGIDVQGTWLRLTVADAFSRYSPLSVRNALHEEKFDEILVEYIEPHLGNGTPLFLCDYPVELGALAKEKTGMPEVVERFELYVNGVELANGFSELTDPFEQRKRFLKEISLIREKRGWAAELPERFLDDLGMLDCAAGIALGLDRLFMVAMGVDNISQAVTFSAEDFG